MIVRSLFTPSISRLDFISGDYEPRLEMKMDYLVKVGFNSKDFFDYLFLTIRMYADIYMLLMRFRGSKAATLDLTNKIPPATINNAPTQASVWGISPQKKYPYTIERIIEE